MTPASSVLFVLIRKATVDKVLDEVTVPLGGGAGKIVRFGRLPVNFQLQTFYNVVTPDNGADWQLRFQFQFLLPK